MQASAGHTRKAADVAIIGSSLQAYGLAYLLAKRSKRVVLLETLNRRHAPAKGAPDLMLHAPSPDAHIAL